MGLEEAAAGGTRPPTTRTGAHGLAGAGLEPGAAAAAELHEPASRAFSEARAVSRCLSPTRICMCVCVCVLQYVCVSMCVSVRWRARALSGRARVLLAMQTVHTAHGAASSRRGGVGEGTPPRFLKYCWATCLYLLYFAFVIVDCCC